MNYLEDFLLKSSFHGLNYIAEKNGSVSKKIFWLLTFLACLTVFSFLAGSTISEFLSTKTKIQIAETNADLGEVVFPSAFVCNNNQFRRSFAYWIIDKLKDDGKLDEDPIIKDGVKRELTKDEQNIFDFIRDIFFEGPAFNNESKNRKLHDKIMNSTFMKIYTDEFLKQKNITHWTEKHQDRNLLFQLFNNNFTHIVDKSSTLSRRMKDFVSMAGQWKIKQMIPHVEWKGTLNKTEKNDEIFMSLEQPTATGICTWIAPLAYKVQEKIPPWPQGVISGENNGLLIVLDTESYDYVENEKGGVGFSLSVLHPLAMPIMEQSGINIQPGTATKLGFSSTLTRTTEEAVKRFNPYERKCWIESEIGFQFIPYDMYYHYSMTNCLFEAAMQEAYRACDCIPSFIKESAKPCFGKKLKCYLNIIEKIGNLQLFVVLIIIIIIFRLLKW